MRKICAKYTKNISITCTYLKIWSVQQPISYQTYTFVTKYGEILDQKEVLIILSTLKAPFFQKKK